MERSHQRTSRGKKFDRAVKHLLEGATDLQQVAVWATPILKSPGTSGKKGHGVNLNQLHKAMEVRTSHTYLAGLVGQKAVDNFQTPAPEQPPMPEQIPSTSDIITP